MLAACSGQNVYDKGVGIMNLKQSLAGGAACVLASATLLWAGAAAAVNSDGYDIPYIGAGYNYEIPDPARDSSGGQGAQFQIGMPLAAYGYENWAAEATLHMLPRDRDIDGKNDYQTGLLFDLVYDFGKQGFGNFGGGYQFKPFLLGGLRSEEHTSELQSLMRISYAVFCLKKKNKQT